MRYSCLCMMCWMRGKTMKNSPQTVHIWPWTVPGLWQKNGFLLLRTGLTKTPKSVSITNRYVKALKGRSSKFDTRTESSRLMRGARRKILRIHPGASHRTRFLVGCDVLADVILCKLWRQLIEADNASCQWNKVVPRYFALIFSNKDRGVFIFIAKKI